MLRWNGITLRRTTTWKDSPHLDRDADLDRIEYVMEHFADGVFAFDEFASWASVPPRAQAGPGDRFPVPYRRTHGITYFHCCYSAGSDTRVRTSAAPARPVASCRRSDTTGHRCYSWAHDGCSAPSEREEITLAEERGEGVRGMPA